MHIELSQEQKSSLDKLIVPFHPDAITWRVTNKSKDRKRGCVIPYGDQRAYTDRLNAVFTPAGWTRVYQVTTLSPIDRVKQDKMIHTGKVIVICVITIHGLGCHSGSGEMWADDDNAVTRAEAQAFKRACYLFGLGRYFYEFAEMWVNLNEYGQPTQLPTLPDWALPPGVRPVAVTKTQTSLTAASQTPSERTSTPQGPQPVVTALDADLTKQIEALRRVVGDALYFEAFRRGGKAKNARDLPSVDAQRWILQQLSTLDRGINTVRALAQDLHQNVFIGVLDAHEVQSIDKFPSFDVLKAVVRDLQGATGTIAA